MTVRRLVFAALAAAAASLAVPGGVPPPNPAGGELIVISAELHSGGVGTNGAGGVLEFSGAMDSSVDGSNPTGARACIGLLDPNGAVSSGAPGWTDYR